MAREEIRSLQRIYTAVQQGDAEELRRSLAHDIEWTLPEALPWGGTRHGPLGIQAFTESYENHVEGLWADPDEFVETDGLILVLGRVCGRARSTGRTFEVPFAHVWQMSDGMPSRFRGYYDTAPIAAALDAGS
jgi:ketosteroid isomerase-like protein